ncbi:hypothetical protein [Tenacibaculum finnmarkense]|uniref:hypothetical protein n=1 Tax=Tenacibaculum finnmarkense TaxID=2781243 RepID=UPI001EFC1F40|nr:hypothetical protein [Tenacibaculum finnmarkense]MCG8237387.1 hypothetical protein [Tenacibaculum finnmarkense genomovar ulcerans]MCG8831514.1 hypothetical protein [Tenacibaculum finnmarkense]
MKIFNFFKNKKVVAKKGDITKKKNIEKKELTPDYFHIVSEEQFKEELTKYFDIEKYGFGISPDENIKIYIGDIEEQKEIDFEGHILIIGNLKKQWINLTISDSSIFDGGGSLFLTGNIESDYFSNDYGRFVMIGGSLLVTKIINTEFENSSLIVNRDLTTEYFHGIDIWAEVKGNIKIDYGWGHCNDKSNMVVLPDNDIETSLLFLNLDNNCNSEKINGLIKKRTHNNV